MTLTLPTGVLEGTVSAIPSKSEAHRSLLCAALADRETEIFCNGSSRDIEATVRCLRAAGADICRTETGYQVKPLKALPETCCMDCGESGSTLRFLLPVAAALGISTAFRMEGRLPKRPLFPLSRELCRHGCQLWFSPDDCAWHLHGKLQAGHFILPGNVSSQFISGLLFALPLLDGESRLTVTKPVESADYLTLTLAALEEFGIQPKGEAYDWHIIPSAYRSPTKITVEGDWSNAAPWLCAGVLAGEGITVQNLNLRSLQGDREICRILTRLGGKITEEQGSVTAKNGILRGQTIHAANVPDLVPVLSAVAACIPDGVTRFVGASRLRLKESDRLAAAKNAIIALGGRAEETEDGLIVYGKRFLSGGTVDAVGDHRIAMLAAVAAVRCTGPVTILGAEAVQKSYPAFWQEFEKCRRKEENE